MEYGEYLHEVDRAADATNGRVVSLAGGYFGVQLATDGANVILALDLDGDQGQPTADQLGEDYIHHSAGRHLWLTWRSCTAP